MCVCACTWASAHGLCDCCAHVPIRVPWVSMHLCALEGMRARVSRCTCARVGRGPQVWLELTGVPNGARPAATATAAPSPAVAQGAAFCPGSPRGQGSRWGGKPPASPARPRLGFPLCLEGLAGS